MTTDTAVMEQALIVMAIAMSVQSLVFAAGAIAGFLAWRKASHEFAQAKEALAAQVAELRLHSNRITGTVENMADTVRRSASAVGDVAADVRNAMGMAVDSLQSVVSVVTAPRAAIAMGVWRGLGVLRRRRAERRASRRASRQAAATVVSEPLLAGITKEN